MIWLDVDCVLADFMAHVENTAHVKFVEPFGFFDLDAEVERLGGPRGWTWRKIEWAEIPPMPWARDLMELLRGQEVGIITACIHQDRKVWLDWFCQGYSHIPRVYTEYKSVVVRGDCLIDDREYATIRVPSQWWYPNWSYDIAWSEIKAQLEEHK
jgi:hypothetical protein